MPRCLHTFVNLLLGQRFLKTHRLPQAVRCLKIVSKRQPEVHIELARIYVRLKDRDAARRHASRAAEHFQEQLNFERKNNQLRLMVVESLARSGQFDKAVSTLRAV